MNVLMVTQRLDMDDDVLGFVHGFIKCLSNKVAGLGIICLEQGRTDLPAKVKIFSMGKEQGRGRLGRFINYQRAMAHLAPKAQVIFGHMNPVYTILAAPWAKLFRRKMVMWYAHGYVGNRLKLAHWLADSVVTATSAGFRIPSHKVRVIGQCIDTNRFYPSPQKRPKGCFKLLSLGRISPVKNIESMLRAVHLIVNQSDIKNLQLQIVGDPGTAVQTKYLYMLQRLVKQLGLEDVVSFTGAVNYRYTLDYYQSAHLFLNMTASSLDKTILEAMACGCLPLSCAPAYTGWMAEHGLQMLSLEKNDHKALAQAIVQLLRQTPALRQTMENKVRDLVVQEHDLEGFVDRLCKVFTEVG